MVLDPLEEIPDVDRLDNVFVQYVEFQDSVEFSPTCNVIGLGSGHGNKLQLSGANKLSLLFIGRKALISFNDIEDQRAVAFNARKRSYYKLKDEEANYARLLSQIGEISSDDTDNTCSGNIKDSKVRNIKILLFCNVLFILATSYRENREVSGQCCRKF